MMNPCLTPAIRQLYNALAVVRMATIRITAPDDPGAGNDPYEIEQWATAELQAVNYWRMTVHMLVRAAAEGDPSAWARRRTLIRGFVAVWLAEQMPDLNQADACDAMVADVVAAINALGAELGVREAVAVS